MPVTVSGQYVDGAEGTAIVGGIQLPIKSWKLKMEAKLLPVTNSKSQGWEENVGGISSWSVTLEAFHDSQLVIEAVGPPAILPKQRVPVVLKRATNDPGYTGTIIVSSVSYDMTVDGVVSYSIEGKGTGSLTLPTAAYTYP